ncbi:hypothetical protein VQ056_04330 [Paenibacillus sp. JTLBN-2024]
MRIKELQEFSGEEAALREQLQRLLRQMDPRWGMAELRAFSEQRRGAGGCPAVCRRICRSMTAAWSRLHGSGSKRAGSWKRPNMSFGGRKPLMARKRRRNRPFRDVHPEIQSRIAPRLERNPIGGGTLARNPS